jgi:16S rRNA (guanine966-N2)-methyltransferase
VKPGGQRRAKRARPGAASVTKGAGSPGGSRRAPAQVRIIGGAWKRTPLPVGDAPGLRPSPDRVRETLFNWLGNLIPDFSLIRGLDLFAGTGALGFELASRGAAHVTLVERNPQLSAQLDRTRQKLSAEQVHLVTGDALALSRSWPDQTFDVVFLDPPFDSGLLEPALAQAARLVASDGVVYVESRAAIDADSVAALGLQSVRAARAGQVHFELLQRA